jgi:hypothetical protein
MNLRIAKKVAKSPERYSPFKVKQAQRMVEGLPVRPAREPITVKSWEHYLEITSKPKRFKSAKRYRNVKSRSPKLAKYKFPWIKN